MPAQKDDVITVTKIYNTCGACPAQWDGETNDGRSVYVRYRWGYLTITINGEELLGAQIGDALDGVMSYRDLKELASAVLALPEREGQVLTL